MTVRGSTGRVPGRLARTVAAALLVLVAILGSAGAAIAAGPPFPERPAGRHIIDDAKLVPNGAQGSLEDALGQLLDTRGIDVVVYMQVKPDARTSSEALADADALLAQWQVGGEDGNGAVMIWDLDRGKKLAQVGIAVGPALDRSIDAGSLVTSVESAMAGSLPTGQWLPALAQGVVALSVGVSGGSPPQASPPPGPDRTARPRATPEPGATHEPLPALGPAPPAGPPFPEPITGLRIYDYASALGRDAEGQAAGMIDAIEARTGAQVVVYTQVKPESDTTADAEHDAAALMEQWGVGRRGFDDGLVILFDLTQDRCHGQAQLFAGSGYEAAFLTRDERQRIFEQDMLPALRECDFDGALLAALQRVDTAATPEHAASLQLARQVDAVTGLVAAPFVLVLLLGWAGWSWLRYGRDPEYLDDNSVLMPAPPPEMTPAAAAVILDGRSGKHALVTALVDLASRGEIAFRETGAGTSRKVEVEITAPDEADPRQARNRRSALGEAELQALRRLRELGGTGRLVSSEDLGRFASSIDSFNVRLDALVAEKGWFREPPDRSVERWSFRGGVILVLGGIGVALGFLLPSNGLLLLGAALLVASAGIFVIARVMPQRTLEGARMYAQLAAYRRTLERTLARSRTMDQVVAAGALPWVQTPDQAVVWSYALGLQEEAEEVLERSMEDIRAGAASPTRTWFPAWFGTVPIDGGRGAAGGRGVAAGLFSASALPDFGHMSAALATIVSPVSSGGGRSGGFSSGGSFGGGSSSGGSGAGGGF